MFEQPFVALVFIGLIIKSVGFLVRDELLLRVLVFTGTFFDIAFYLVQTPTIWGPVLTNSILVSVNLVLSLIILMERSPWFMSDKDHLVFEYFKTLNPGQFRRINRSAKWHEATEETVLLREGVRSDRLYFIQADQFCVVKHGTRYTATGPAFAGEIMLLQGGVASASVIVQPGTIYAEWSVYKLRAAMQRSQALENAMVARFGHDLADKVRNSVPIGQPEPEFIPPAQPKPTTTVH